MNQQDNTKSLRANKPRDACPSPGKARSRALQDKGCDSPLPSAPGVNRSSFLLNGLPAFCPPGQSLHAYLLEAGLDPQRVVAEVNGLILKPESFTGHILNAGDQVEIIHFVGGG